MLDLRTQYPRSLREKLAGYVHVGRMIDKCRAVLAGTQGDYVYPCPLDRRLLEFAGMEAEQFLRAVEGRPDDAVVDWFQATAVPHSASDMESWNHAMLVLGPETREKWDYFRKVREDIDPDRTDIVTWADLLDLEERRHVPVRTATHTQSWQE